ncbi:MAG: (P)ppGpp synthetase I, SpoT/RelA [Candidatus Woesebacteria bacterium GW2011_GWB1_43_14]|uniref:(P)ppGpp synthetase I, SpoT/RelA n=1 Tax=Candidatus Woesebacteria bacterium GW2011_GWB1_43_14 TaxID=1618578 RepID=A0A0G1DHL2_9BACT|nr:MAG: (P)ppGpp synthetase I, SpoT/RelA [Candidatus Woesebacteria bacterium GW2011_GWA1_39_11b]KKS78065.1 MAG: (P)ppGpp synthetase I, SpoT/RelA [Candidatus Woesebacteria bacterium GW2011_GWC1_42_9]KKS97355.1 MAG: (P)ppGpp synthetase I, SpoT/RelA [Candidatus Woesebacteria bacterium GW2011_GWB1_43_14]
MTEKGLESQFSSLLKEAKVYLKNKDIKTVVSAWDFAKSAHAGQKRLSGDPYIIHPLEVAKTLVHWKLDRTSIVAGLLHDVIEDTEYKEKDIEKKFGKPVANLVNGVTKVTSLRLKGSREEVFIETLRKMILVMAKDLRVVLIKLADRLHNMKTLGALPIDKQRENALETLEIYAPLSERLGIGEIKGRLEDLAFPYVYPKEFERINKLSKRYYEQSQNTVEKMQQRLTKELEKNGIKAKITGRRKHLYSLWRKLERKGIGGDFEKVQDIIALRIIVNTDPDCYGVLGIVHAIYKPVPKIGVSDFIALPKPNGYQSIHTKVFSPNSHIVEVQIRTHAMHDQAEHGACAHWMYSSEKNKGVSDRELEDKGIKVGSKLSWVKELVRWQDELADSKEFLEAVKFDALNHRNFIFSPKGDVYDLPQGATPVDFAFVVHTGLGKYIRGATVNDKIVSLDQKLFSGDVVEIIKSKEARRPNRDWLEFVVTTVARREILKEARKINN